MNAHDDDDRRLREVFGAPVELLPSRPGGWDAVVATSRRRRTIRRARALVAAAAGLVLVGAVVVAALPPGDHAATGQLATSGAGLSVPPAPTSSPRASTTSRMAATLMLRPDGIGYLDQGPTAVGAAATGFLAFGAPAQNARSLMTAAFGDYTEQSLPDCGASVVTLSAPDTAFQLVLENGLLAGWSESGSSARQPRTGTGLGVGSSRQQLLGDFPSTTISSTTLGQEFTTAAPGQTDPHTSYTGTLSGSGTDATVQFLAAGRTCTFR